MNTPFSEVPIHFTQPLTKQEAMEGKSAVFCCQISKVRSNEHVTWTKDGEQIIPEDEHYEMGWKDLTHTLCLPRVTLQDAASYTMMVDHISSSAQLVVHGEDIVQMYLLHNLFKYFLLKYL